jgi:hypothetical protein
VLSSETDRGAKEIAGLGVTKATAVAAAAAPSTRRRLSTEGDCTGCSPNFPGEGHSIGLRFEQACYAR